MFECVMCYKTYKRLDSLLRHLPDLRLNGAGLCPLSQCGKLWVRRMGYDPETFRFESAAQAYRACQALKAVKKRSTIYAFSIELFHIFYFCHNLILCPFLWLYEKVAQTC